MVLVLEQTESLCLNSSYYKGLFLSNSLRFFQLFRFKKNSSNAIFSKFSSKYSEFFFCNFLRIINLTINQSSNGSITVMNVSSLFQNYFFFKIQQFYSKYSLSSNFNRKLWCVTMPFSLMSLLSVLVLLQ